MSHPRGVLSDTVRDAATARTVIVIFGARVGRDGSPSATLRRRVAAALRCGAACDAPLYVPSGAALRGRPAEAVVMAGLLRGGGVAEADIALDVTARNTLGSVRAVANLLRAHRGPVLAASSDWHLKRCLWLLRRAGIAAKPCAAAERDSMPILRRLYWLARERAAFVYDAMLLRISP